MSEQHPEEETQTDQPETEPGVISDEQLPEDLQPTEDNPLARHPGQTGDDDDRIGNTEGDDSYNPSASMGYGSDDNSSG